jgi:DNA-binding response OmpR family regulator
MDELDEQYGESEGAAEADGDGATRIPLVLIVEDSAECQYLWERYLSMIQCRVASAYCGVDALELIRQERPAAIILDVMLPDVDGWHILRAIKKDRATQDVPVVMCSALDEREFGFLLGADEYLCKPVTCRMFLSALARVGVR